MANMQQFWVFGYGSLMWRPGFDFRESEPALIHGFHRSLCVYSFVHRGTPERPGLVLGLDRGGSCHGMAFRVPEKKWHATLAYLRAREQVTSVYLEAMRPIRLLNSGRKVEAVAYVVDRNHRQYAGKLDTGRLLALVNQGRGQSGKCTDYVWSTLAHLREMAIRDSHLEVLAPRLPPQAASLTD
jgi:cation transport protein ChaC